MEKPKRRCWGRLVSPQLCPMTGRESRAAAWGEAGARRVGVRAEGQGGGGRLDQPKGAQQEVLEHAP